MTYEVIILGHLHMPLYFIGTFTEYSYHSDTGKTIGMPYEGVADEPVKVMYKVK